MSSILSSLRSGPSGEPCSKTRYCAGLWARGTSGEWLHKRERRMGLKLKQQKEWFSPLCLPLLIAPSWKYFLHLHSGHSSFLFKPWWLLCNSAVPLFMKSHLKVISSRRNCRALFFFFLYLPAPLYISWKGRDRPSDNEVDSNDT